MFNSELYLVLHYKMNLFTTTLSKASFWAAAHAAGWAAASQEQLSSPARSLWALQVTTGLPVRLLLPHWALVPTMSPDVPHHGGQGGAVHRPKLQSLMKSFCCLEDYTHRLLPSKAWKTLGEGYLTQTKSAFWSWDTITTEKTTGPFPAEAAATLLSWGYGITDALSTHSYIETDSVNKQLPTAIGASWAGQANAAQSLIMRNTLGSCCVAYSDSPCQEQ